MADTPGHGVRLIASLVVRNEIGRYLEPCIDHLRRFCDLIVVLDDASDDGTGEWLDERADEQLVVRRQSPPSSFYRHEGRTRALLLERTLEQQPTHVLPLDADEFVTDGPALRKLIEAQPQIAGWPLPIQEVWETAESGYRVREDGGWASGRTLVWRRRSLGRLSFPNRALACGRVPLQVRGAGGGTSGVALLHVGWLDERERVARVARYTKHDGGRFHARAHLDSILWPPERVQLADREWPAGLEPWRAAITAKTKVAA